MKKGTMCFNCGAKDAYELKSTKRDYKGDGYHFTLLVEIPYCKNCGAPIYDAAIEDAIAKKANKKIQEQRNRKWKRAIEKLRRNKT